MHARECDPVTRRDVYEKTLPDSLVRLNARTNLLLGQAVAEFNLRFAGSSRKLGARDIERYLALYIHNAIARESRIMLPQEEEEVPYAVDFFYSMSKSGKGPLQEWLEDPAAQGAYLEHLDECLYHDAYPAGFNDTSTIKLAGVLLGPDKVDHFFDQGYAYWRISGYGKDDRRAIDYGVDSEFSWYGLAVAGVFSYADLRANWAGYRFFKSLREYYTIDSRQFMSLKKGFSWADWVDWQWDELLNPSAINADVLGKMLAWADYRDRNLSPAGTAPSLRQTCRTLQEEARGISLKRSAEYLNDKIPASLSTYRDLVSMVAAGQLVAQSGTGAPGQ